MDNISAQEWFHNNAFPEVYAKKYNVTSRGLFGASLEDISALSFIPEAAFDFNKSDLRKSKRSFAANSEDEYKEAANEESDSYTFVKGLTELTNKLGDVLKSKIKLESYVLNISQRGNKYLVVYNKNNQQDTIVANKIVLAVPSPIALKIASTIISKERTELINNIQFASYATVALFSSTPIFNKAFDLAVPDDYFFTDIYDAAWVERFYTKKEIINPIISVYIGPRTCKDHSLDSMSDQELIQKVYTDLDKIFPGASTKITGFDIERFPYGYPVMSLGAYKNLLRLNELNKGSLILAGDYMIYPTFEAAVQFGYLAAKEIIKQ